MTSAAQNKATVLEAFDTLFNKRDYDKAAKFWSPNYIQHSAHIEPGRDGLFNLVKALPHTLRYEYHLIMAEGDMVMLHGRFSGNGGPGEPDRCRYPAFGKRHPRRTLGRPAGRGHQGTVEERAADVRGLISSLMTSDEPRPAPSHMLLDQRGGGCSVATDCARRGPPQTAEHLARRHSETVHLRRNCCQSS